MRRRLRIGLRLDATGTMEPGHPGNVQGDEQVARAWQRYLLRREEVESVHLFSRQGPIDRPIDVLIHFTVFGEIAPGTRNLLYLQNAFPPDVFPGGTVGMFRRVRSRYDGFLFTSEALMRSCAPGAVVPFATDPEVFFPCLTEALRHRVAFVGNDIRGPRVNARYLLPALPFGLVIYGHNAWPPPLAAACRGKLHSEDLARLYSSAAVNLNAHIDEHVRWDTLNLRLYDALACAGFVLSDATPSLDGAFDGAVAKTEGDADEWALLVWYLADDQERRRRGELGRRVVLSRHTWYHRAEAVVQFLREVV